MLFTRCPDCLTTFRVTSEALRKADGRVRCGRCASVFDARDSLEERPDVAPTPPAGAQARAATEPDARSTGDQTTGGEQATAASEIGTTPGSDEEASYHAAAARANVTASRDAQAAADAAAARDATIELWDFADVEASPPRRVALWPTWVTVAFLVLLGQAVHHYRSELAASELAGPPLTRLYALLGQPLAPRWDVEQYEIVDSAAAMQPAATGLGRLVISAHIRNRGPRAQPFPQIDLRLLDRWEDAVGRRAFSPHEYLVDAPEPDALMQPGEIAEARLIVVDPGPDADGFAVDVCVATESDLDCAADAVFR